MAALTDLSNFNLNFSSDELIPPIFSIQIEGYEESAHAVGNCPLCRHAALAYAHITGKALQGSPAGAFEIVGQRENCLVIRLKSGVEITAIQKIEPGQKNAGANLQFGKNRKGGAPNPDSMRRHLFSTGVHATPGTFLSPK